jgi:hypothetical protein
MEDQDWVMLSLFIVSFIWIVDSRASGVEAFIEAWDSQKSEIRSAISYVLENRGRAFSRQQGRALGFRDQGKTPLSGHEIIRKEYLQ